MNIRILYFSLLFTTNVYSQSFVGCSNGLNAVPRGLFYDRDIDKLVVFGEFDSSGMVRTRGCATWDDVKFDSLGPGNKFAHFGGTLIKYRKKLYAQFSDGFLHEFRYSTGTWSKIEGWFDGTVWDATIFNDELVLVGEFQNVSGLKARNIVRFDGSQFDTFPNPTFTFWLKAVEVYKNELYIGGLFDPQPFQCIAKFNGTSWQEVSPGLQINGHSAWDFEKYNGKLFICGKWDAVNNIQSKSIIAWDGLNWHNLKNGLKFNNGISGAAKKMKVHNDKLFVFGGFEKADTIPSSNIGIWNDSTWCASSVQINFLPDIVETYKGFWYFGGPYSALGSIVNRLGKYIGNGGILEGACPIVAELKENQEVQTFQLFPNPARDFVEIKNAMNIRGIKLINGIGSLVMERIVNGESASLRIKTNEFKAGIYVIILSGPDGLNCVRKLVIAH